MTKADSYAHMAVLLATFIVATSFPIGQRIAAYLDPVLVVLLRFVLSIILILPLVIFFNKIKIPTARRLIQFGLIGFSQAGFFILMFLALRQTSSLHTSVIYTLLPSLAAVTSFYLLKEKLRRLHFFLLPIGILATVWVIFEGSMDKLLQMDLNQGDFIFGVGLVFLAFYATLLKKFHNGESPLTIVFWSMACAVFPMMVYYSYIFSSVHLQSVPLEIYAWIIYLAVTTVFTNFAWAYGGSRLGPMKTMAYSYLIPTFVLFINWIVINKLPPMIVLPGILVGVIIMFFLQRSKNTLISKSKA